MHAIEDILRAYEEGRPALLLTGRSLYDLVVDAEGKLRPLVETLRRTCAARYGMAFVSCSLAGALDWDSTRVPDERDRRTIEKALRAHHLLDTPEKQNGSDGERSGLAGS